MLHGSVVSFGAALSTLLTASQSFSMTICMYIYIFSNQFTLYQFKSSSSHCFDPSVRAFFRKVITQETAQHNSFYACLRGFSALTCGCARDPWVWCYSMCLYAIVMLLCVGLSVLSLSVSLN